MSDRPRVRVKATARPLPAPAASQRPRAGYLRDTRSAVIETRPAYLREHRDEVARVWQRSAGLALDIIQNSGQLRGAADQVIADTVGVELVLNPQPDLEALGYSPEEGAALVKKIKSRWKRWAWNSRECDLRGKFNLPQMIDIVLRWEMAFGEAVGLIDYMSRPMRRRFGIRTGTKVCLVTPTRLVQDTNEFEGIFQGVIHDPVGRPVAYRIEERVAGFNVKKDHRAFDADGRQRVVHVFDPMDASDVRGISRLAAAFRQHLQGETLVDVTIQTAILQTVFAAALTSSLPAGEAFEAIEAMGRDHKLGDQFRDYFLATLDKAAEGEISIGGSPRVSQLAPGEKLELLSTQTPGPEFVPLKRELSRDMARAIGISFGGLTMNHENATYSSVRMETSSIWPVVMRRRERIAAPPVYAAYDSWFDEEVGEGRIEVKGGYEAFAANRDLYCWAILQGPAKPSADDAKSAKASSERLWNGTSTLADECAELGRDPDEVFNQRVAEHRRYVEAGLPSPFERAGGAKKDDADDPEPAKRREPA